MSLPGLKLFPATPEHKKQVSKVRAIDELLPLLVEAVEELTSKKSDLKASSGPRLSKEDRMARMIHLSRIIRPSE
jgi:hypothetical protein